MGLLDSLVGAVSGGLGDGKGDNPLSGLMDLVGNSGVMDQVSGLIGGQGGLQGLVSSFSSAGLGDVVQSWVGTGENQSVSAADLTSVFGADKLSAMAQAAGVNLSDLTGMLAKALPSLVDKATPNGELPAEGGFDVAGLLGGLLKG